MFSDLHFSSVSSYEHDNLLVIPGPSIIWGGGAVMAAVVTLCLCSGYFCGCVGTCK